MYSRSTVPLLVGTPVSPVDAELAGVLVRTRRTDLRHQLASFEVAQPPLHASHDPRQIKGVVERGLYALEMQDTGVHIARMKGRNLPGGIAGERAAGRVVRVISSSHSRRTGAAAKSTFRLRS